MKPLFRDLFAKRGKGCTVSESAFTIYERNDMAKRVVESGGVGAAVNFYGRSRAQFPEVGRVNEAQFILKKIFILIVETHNSVVQAWGMLF